ncbi:MAG: hypothetical protein KAT79_00660 [candidate division Zixibacteria bacterium]|nr:hypothetical protein [candidate division Zixibacteria bacterium]
MNETLLFWLCILVGMVGLAVVTAIIWFGRNLIAFRVENSLFDHPIWHELAHRDRKMGRYGDDLPRHVLEGYSEYLQRRNEFWTTYGQVLIAILIVTILSILLLTSVISAEAGLPILSGISGFAIAKGVAGSKTISIPQGSPQG